MSTAAIVFCPFVAMAGFSGREASIPPLAPALLKGCLNEEGISAVAHDFNLSFHQEFTDNDFVSLVAWITTPGVKIELDLYKKYQKFVSRCVDQVLFDLPEVVCVSLFSHQSQRFAEDFCYRIKTKSNVHVIVGGGGVGTHLAEYEKIWADLAVDSGLADAALLGEAELIIADLVTLKEPGVHRAPQLYNEELKDLPVPNFDDYDLDSYGARERIKLPITASKGCVRKCSFCDVASIWPKFRYRRGENVAKEMITVYQKYGIKNFSFTDSLLNGGLKPFREMNQILSDCLPGILSYEGQFICRNSSAMPPSDFELMKAGGCKYVSIGIESGSESVRNHMKKEFSSDDLDYTAQQLIEKEILQSWNIIVGYPTETDDDWQQTLDLIHRYRRYSELVKIQPIGVFQMLQDTPITTKESLNELNIELHNTHGYSEYNWISGLNPTNDLPTRVRRWHELVDLCEKYNMLYLSPVRIKQRTLILQQQLDFYEKKSTYPVFQLREQSFQEPTNFID